MKQNVIIIAGMHRSGTSLSGNLLEKSGLFIGEQLLSNGFDNKKGHFEDLEILKIHETDLKLKGLDTRGLKGAISGNLSFESSTNKAVDAFLSTRENKPLWGWKEPRTTLYLQAWKRKLPEAKCIAVYRHYDDVASSLIKRYNYKLKYGVGMSTFIRAKHVLLYPLSILIKRYEAYKSWHIYNQNILDFKEQNPNDVVIVELNHFMEHYNAIINEVNTTFETELRTIDVSTVFDAHLLSSHQKKVVFFRLFSNKNLKAVRQQLKHKALWI